MIDQLKQGQKEYVGTKVIRAVPLLLGEYNEFRGWPMPENENPLEEGYLVEYEPDTKPNVEGFDGYISWTPKHAFDISHNRIFDYSIIAPSNPILNHFKFDHLPPHLQAVSRLTALLAKQMDAMLPDGQEKSAGMRKLLEAKDCFVRANLEVNKR